jgi:hypothetical protein
MASSSSSSSSASASDHLSPANLAALLVKRAAGAGAGAGTGLGAGAVAGAGAGAGATAGATAAAAAPAAGAALAAERWLRSTWAVAAQTPAVTLAVNAAFELAAVGTTAGAVRLFDAGALGGAPLWERAEVHAFPVSCAAFLDSEAPEDAGEEVAELGLLATGAPDAQLALQLLDAPPERCCSPRLAVLLLLLLAAAAAAAILYARAAADAKGGEGGDEL